jgi:hypothetical protein
MYVYWMFKVIEKLIRNRYYSANHKHKSELTCQCSKSCVYVGHTHIHMSQQQQQQHHHHAVWCAFCKANARHPLFLYVITDKRQSLLDLLNREDKQQQEKEKEVDEEEDDDADAEEEDVNADAFHVYIGLSSHPEVYVRSHNRDEGYRAGPKVTKAVAPYWEVQLALEIKSNSKQFKFDCRKAARKGIASLIACLCERSAKTGLPLLCKQRSFVQQIYERYTSKEV